MIELTKDRGTLSDFRTAMQAAQQAGVFASDTKLSMAARETIKRLSEALETYDELCSELVEEHTATTEAGRPIRVFEGAGAVVRLGEENEQGLDEGWYKYPLNGEASKVDPSTFGRRRGVQLENEEGYYERKAEYDEQEMDVQIDPVEEEYFHEHANWNEQAEAESDLLLLRNLWMTK